MPGIDVVHVLANNTLEFSIIKKPKRTTAAPKGQTRSDSRTQSHGALEASRVAGGEMRRTTRARHHGRLRFSSLCALSVCRVFAGWPLRRTAAEGLRLQRHGLPHLRVDGFPSFEQRPFLHYRLQTRGVLAGRHGLDQRQHAVDRAAQALLGTCAGAATREECLRTVVVKRSPVGQDNNARSALEWSRVAPEEAVQCQSFRSG